MFRVCHRWIAFIVAPLLVAAIAPGAAYTQQRATDLEKEFITVAESSEYTQTADEAQVAGYLRKLANLWNEAELTAIGETNEGRPLWALVVSPTERTETKPLTVLLLGGIHSGECAGKEGLLALARDMALGKRGNWWKSLRIIWVPNFNADGNQRRGVSHRPGQAGPKDGMGIRENAQGLDLNRDFVKIDSPEVGGLVATLSEYEVDVLIDTHTTNGSLHQYQLTYDIPHNPATPRAVENWLRGGLMPQVQSRLQKKGYKTFWYGNYDAAHRRWNTFGHEPRYSTEYMGLRGKIGILSEAYSYASYETRVRVSYHFVEECLRGLVENQLAVRQMLDASEMQAKAGMELPIRAEIKKTADGVTTNGYQKPDGTPPRPPYGAHSFGQHEPRNHILLRNRDRMGCLRAIPKLHHVIPRLMLAERMRPVGRPGR
ncbi:MAG: M14 family metallopeptidase, partial [Planctomycetota bacterium]